jgi:putative cell wall-binding protein
MVRRTFQLVLVAALVAPIMFGLVRADTTPHAVAFEVPFQVVELQETPDADYETSVVEEPFTMAGMSWTGRGPTKVWFRVGSGDGPWTEWEPLGAGDEHSPDWDSDEYAQQRNGTDPVYTGPNDRIQFRFAGTRPRAARAALVDTTDRTTPFLQKLVNRLAPVPAQSAPPQPLVHARSEWDPTNRCEPRDIPDENQVTAAFVHHTSTSNSANTYPASQVAGIILSYCLYHRNSRGWDDIGYNFLIDRFGRTWEGRAGGIERGITGAHTSGVNAYSTGIALIGYFTSAAPSASAQQALTDLLTWKLGLHNLDPKGSTTVVSKGSNKYAEGTVVTLPTIAGHRDAQSTACPGNVCYGLLGSFRNNVAAAWTQLPANYYESPVVGDFTGDGVADGAAYRKSDGTWWVTDGVTGSSASWSDGADGIAWTLATAGNFDGDPAPEIIGLAGSTSYLVDPAGASFSHTPLGTLGGTPIASVTGDFDDDGRDEAAFVDATGSIMVFDESGGAGWGTFGAAVTRVTAGDHDNDGKTDLAALNGSGSVVVAKSDGASFSPETWLTLSGSADWKHLVTADFDGDGSADVAAFDESADTWHVATSDGTSFVNLRTATTESLLYWSEAFAIDHDRDGRAEIVALDADTGSWYLGRLIGPTLVFTKTEDAPYRTTVQGPASLSTGPTYLSFFGQEFSWVQTTVGFGAGFGDDMESTVRLAGSSRYSTAAVISQSAFPGKVDTVFVSTGANWPDALAGGVAAARVGSPVLLTEPNTLPTVTRNEIVRLDPDTIVILGGPGAVSDSVAQTLAGLTDTVTRWEGSDRYSTAAAVSNQAFPSADTVFIATGRNFPDALSGIPAAAAEGAPILLTEPDVLPTGTKDELKRLGPDRIYILGGTGAVSAAVEAELASYSTEAPIRVAGSDRFATAAAVAKRFFGPGPLVYITTGLNYPDAVAGGAVAAYFGAPILLVMTDSLPAPTLSRLVRLEPEAIVVLGGVGAVSDTVVEELSGFGWGSLTESGFMLPRP